MITTKKYKLLRLLVTLVLVLLCAFPVHAASGTYTPKTGISVSVSDATNTTETDDHSSITVTAKGSGGLWGIGSYSTTAKIVIENTGDTRATISCSVAKTSVNKLQIQEGSSGTLSNDSFSVELDAGGTATLELITAENNTTNKVVLSDFNYTAAAAESTVKIVFDSTLGTVTAAGSAATSGTEYTVSLADGIALSASTNSGVTFLGWKNEVTHEKVNLTDGNFIPTADITLRAMFASATSKAWFLVDNAYWFDDLNAASTQGTRIVLASDGTLPEGNYTIQSGDTLLIPFDSAHTLIAGNANYNAGGALNPSYPYVVSAYDETASARSQYRVMTMASGAHITVASTATISVESKLANQFVGQVGPYGAIVMHNNSTITVQSGGTLCANGYIFPVYDKDGKVTERGTVTVQSGGTVYEPMSIMDYPGSGTLVTNLLNADTFPMRSYAARNVEVPMTLHSGAKEYAFACLYGDSIWVGTNPLYVLIIAHEKVNNETPLFQNSGTITKSYENGRMAMTIHGNFTLNSLTVQVNKGTVVNISTSETTGCYIPSCYDLTVASGTVTINDNLIVCEGSTITINKGATVQTAKNLYILDADNDPGAVGNVAGVGATGIGGGWNGCSIDVQDVHGKYYTYVPTDAVVDVNGTLSAGATFYTSAAGACITSSESGGKVVITGAPTDTTVNVKKTNDHASVAVTAAKLKNSDETYVETASVGAGTYTYKNGFWYSDSWIILDGFSLDIEGEILLNLKFDLPQWFLDTDGAYVHVTEEDCGINPSEDRDWRISATALTTEIPAYNEETDTNGCLTSWTYGEESEAGRIERDEEGRYVFSQGIAAGEMSGKVTVAFYDGSSETPLDVHIVRDGTTESPVTRTVADFAKLSFDSAAESTVKAKLSDMCQAMLTYGRYAQDFYDIAILAPSYALLKNDTRFEGKYVSIDDFDQNTVDKIFTETGSVDGCRVSEILLDLDSTIDMRVYFDTTNANLTYRVLRPGETGEGTLVDLTDGYVEIVNVPPAYWNDSYSIIVSDGTNKYKVTSSVYDWIRACLDQGSNDHEKNMAKAMYHYCTSAEAYFAAKKNAETT